MKITAVLVMERIEPSLAFWVDRMGFQKLAEVPDGDQIGFAMLSGSGAELMLQTIGSVRKDEPKFVPESRPAAALFIEVDDFADVLKRLEGYPITMPERVTFYGMREIGVFEPGGHTVIFAVQNAGSAAGG